MSEHFRAALAAIDDTVGARTKAGTILCNDCVGPGDVESDIHDSEVGWWDLTCDGCKQDLAASQGIVR